MNYLDRIKQMKSERKITNEQLAQQTGIPLGTLSKLLAGLNDSPKLSNVVAICDVLDCSIDYILTGNPDNTNNYTLDDGEIKLIERYRSLDAHGREMVVLVLDKESERLIKCDFSAEPGLSDMNRRSVASSRGTGHRAVVLEGKFAESRKENVFDKRKLPLYDLGVSAGTGLFLDDATATEEIKIPASDKTKTADLALRINGNSMEPKYRNGDILLVENCESVEIGEPAIFVLDGEGYFKIYGGDRLLSLNPEYGDILLKDFEEVHCVGRVLGKLRRK